jgi:AraC-like DNA-binding protein
MMAEGKAGRIRVSMGYFYEGIPHRLRVQKGRSLTFPLHLHVQAELVYVLTGNLFVTVESTRRLLGAGEAALILPGSVHGYETPDESEHIIAIADISLLGEYREALTNFHCLNPFLPRDAVHPDVLHCLEALSEDAGLDEPLRRAYLSVALGRTLGALPLEPLKGPGGRDAVHSLLTYISAHLADPLSLDDLSKALFLNRYTISKLFSERIGCSLNDYVNALRVSMAENLLRDPQADVSRIAEKCGFGSERTLYRAFRSQRGVTPGQLRRALNRAKA